MVELYDTHPEGRYQSSFKSSMETVKREVLLEDYAATVTELQAFGRGWWTGRCPKPGHEDQNPSFYVYPGSAGAAHAHCYGCGFHGDLFDLFQAVEGGELWEAMMELSRRFGVELPKRPAAWYRRQERQKTARNGIEAALVLAARRRLYRRVFEPVVLAGADEGDRLHDAELFWEATAPIAADLVGVAMRGRDDG